MSKTLLLTSFAIWEPHQRSNASDDLLLLLETELILPSLHLLRQLPVDFELAPEQAIACCNQLQPDIVVCCGMAESRISLTVESRAVTEDQVLNTKANLERLILGLAVTEISHDAGQFVCNWLYYALLKHFQDMETVCLFVHVPILTAKNREAIVTDFRLLITRLLDWETTPHQPEKFEAI